MNSGSNTPTQISQPQYPVRPGSVLYQLLERANKESSRCGSRVIGIINNTNEPSSPRIIGISRSSSAGNYHRNNIRINYSNNSSKGKSRTNSNSRQPVENRAFELSLRKYDPIVSRTVPNTRIPSPRRPATTATAEARKELSRAKVYSYKENHEKRLAFQAKSKRNSEIKLLSAKPPISPRSQYNHQEALTENSIQFYRVDQMNYIQADSSSIYDIDYGIQQTEWNRNDFVKRNKHQFEIDPEQEHRIKMLHNKAIVKIQRSKNSRHSSKDNKANVGSSLSRQDPQEIFTINDKPVLLPINCCDLAFSMDEIIQNVKTEANNSCDRNENLNVRSGHVEEILRYDPSGSSKDSNHAKDNMVCEELNFCAITLDNVEPSQKDKKNKDERTNDNPLNVMSSHVDENCSNCEVLNVKLKDYEGICKSLETNLTRSDVIHKELQEQVRFLNDEVGTVKQWNESLQTKINKLQVQSKLDPNRKIPETLSACIQTDLSENRLEMDELNHALLRSPFFRAAKEWKDSHQPKIKIFNSSLNPLDSEDIDKITEKVKGSEDQQVVWSKRKKTNEVIKLAEYIYEALGKKLTHCESIRTELHEQVQVLNEEVRSLKQWNESLRNEINAMKSLKIIKELKRESTEARSALSELQKTDSKTSELMNHGSCEKILPKPTRTSSPFTAAKEWMDSHGPKINILNPNPMNTFLKTNSINAFGSEDIINIMKKIKTSDNPQVILGEGKRTIEVIKAAYPQLELDAISSTNISAFSTSTESQEAPVSDKHATKSSGDYIYTSEMTLSKKLGPSKNENDKEASELIEKRSNDVKEKGMESDSWDPEKALEEERNIENFINSLNYETIDNFVKSLKNSQ